MSLDEIVSKPGHNTHRGRRLGNITDKQRPSRLKRFRLPKAQTENGNFGHRT